MKKEIIIALVLASTIVATTLLTMRFGRFFEFSNSFSNFSRVFTFATQNSTAVAIGSHLFVISNYQTYISIESTDWNYSYCNVSVDEKDKIIGRLDSAAVAGRIFVWDFDGQHVNKTRLANLTFLLLDPRNCSYKALPNLVYSIPMHPLQVTVNKEYLDIFFPHQNEKCAPCRFDDNGEEIKLQHLLRLESSVPNSTYIRAFNEGSNYVYAYQLGEDTAVVQILDQNFNTLKQTNISFAINELVVTSNSASTSIGILWQSREQKQQHITVLDFWLQPIFTAQLPYPRAYEIAGGLSMDSLGNSFVTSVLLGDIAQKYRLLRYNLTGYLNCEIELDEYNQPDASLSTQSFLLDDREYCLVNHCNITGRTYAKCLDV